MLPEADHRLRPSRSVVRVAWQITPQDLARGGGHAARECLVDANKTFFDELLDLSACKRHGLECFG
jgi:hypothetical protein